MRTSSFKGVLHGVARRMGMKPSTNLNKDEAEVLADYINTAVRFGWTLFPWPEWCPLASDLTVTDGVVLYEQQVDRPFFTIEGFLGIWDGDPRPRNSTAKEIRYSLDTTGARMRRTPETAWVWYRRVPPVFSAVTIDEAGGATYGVPFYDAAAGEVLVPTEGYGLPAWALATVYTALGGGGTNQVLHGNVLYSCITSHTAAEINEPGTGGDWTDFWNTDHADQRLPIDPTCHAPVRFPYVLREAVIAAATATSLAEDGQIGSAEALARDLEALLANEIYSIRCHQKQDADWRQTTN